jgi:hypothetical protein
MKSFANWVMSHKNEHTPFGDLARDLCSDANVKKTWCHRVLRNYLADYPACPEVMEIIEEMRVEYRRQKNEAQGSSPPMPDAPLQTL